MATRSLLSFLLLTLFLFFTPVHAKNRCTDIFGARVEPSLITQLERNQRIDWFVLETRDEGVEVLWTLAYSDDSQFYSLIEIVNRYGDILHTSARLADYLNEKNFYHKVAPLFEPEVELIKMPGVGKRIIHISPEVQVKLLVKHGFDAKFLFKALQRGSGQQSPRKYFNDLHHPESVPYEFTLFHRGEKLTLVVVLLRNEEDPEMFDVLTAYVAGAAGNQVFIPLP